MNRLQPEDIDLFKAHRSLIDHLFKKSTVDGLCNLAFYRRVAENVAGDLLQSAHSLSLEETNVSGIRGDWHSRFENTMGALRRHVRDMNEYKYLGYRICEAYTRLILDHEDDLNCNRILHGLRGKGFANIPDDGTCS